MSPDDLQVQENLNNNGTIDFLTLSGAAAQSVFGTGTITNLKLNKSAGTATCTGGMQRILATLNLTAGNLAADGYLTLNGRVSLFASCLVSSTRNELAKLSTFEKSIFAGLIRPMLSGG
jgi:hypothetical protein